jgi:hypothetical protein
VLWGYFVVYYSLKKKENKYMILFNKVVLYLEEEEGRVGKNKMGEK